MAHPTVDPLSYPKAHHSPGRCLRNSLRYASKKHWGAITRAMREIYTSPTVEAAEARFDAFADDWEHPSPAMIGSWRQAWNEFTPFLEFPAELRKVVYTTDQVRIGSGGLVLSLCGIFRQKL